MAGINLLRGIVLLAVLTATLAAKPYTVAVIGLVHAHAWGHLKEIAASEEVRLVGVSETNPDLIRQAEDTGIPSRLIFGDYRKMLDAVRPDFVWAFVENNRHLEIVRACAARGIPVILEKPLASSYADSIAIRDVARQAGIFVLTNYQYVWWPANHAARRLVEDGAIGRVYRLRGLVGNSGPGHPPNAAVRVFYDWLVDPIQNGGGALVDFGCYNVLWSLWYFGRPSTVYAIAGQLQSDRNPQVEDYATLVLKYRDREAILEGSWDLPNAYEDLEVFGEGGSVAMTERGVTLRLAGRPEQRAEVDPLPPENAGPIACMVNALKTHRAPAGLVGLDLNVEVMEIIAAAKESIRTGKSVPLP